MSSYLIFAQMEKGGHTVSLQHRLNFPKYALMGLEILQQGVQIQSGIYIISRPRSLEAAIVNITHKTI